MMSGKFTAEETNRRINLKVMIEYFKRVEKSLKKLDDREMGHFYKLICSLDVERNFSK